MDGVERLGIMGGTFDPPHLGHLVAAEMARAQMSLGRVLFVPANRSPWKMSKTVSATEQRVEMVSRAIAGHPQFELCRVDVDRPPPSYTYETLRLLGEQYRGCDLFFIMGLDALRDLGNWHHADEIVRLARLVVCARPGIEMDVGQMMSLMHKLPGLLQQLTFVEMPELEIAASDLQERVHNGQSIRYLVPEAVRAYIEAQGLYR
ncbi:MAG: nicotinate-nucleotide adenylyltransferase [Chloroflexi bacterium]|nr:nicotinate-nucleotide adenylyltransferase [Chloroflexota bacterium]